MSSLGIVVPLYIYPTLVAWTDVLSNISANPNITFSVVVNPGDGPGSNQYPNSDYVTGLAQLNTYSNTQLYGYVHTTWGNEPLAAVKANITKYHGWASYREADIHLDGILFDEAPPYDASNFTYMSSLSNFTRTTMNVGFDKIIFNPGAVPDTHYYALADTIVAFENAYSAYSDAVLGWIPEQYWNQTALLIYGFTGTEKDQRQLVVSLLEKGLAGMFISTEYVYNTTSRLWMQFCEDMLEGLEI
jgi:hypothetical protein